MSLPAPAENASLADWLAYLETLHKHPIDLGLERIRRVADRLSLDTPYKKITVAGTNGKGSVCAMLEAILLAAGYRVGTYTSPHLVSYNERIRINGEQASDQAIIQQFRQIDAARGEITLSYFEFSTLAALLLFKASGVDVAVLEVGLGGRLDAVNMVDTDCAIVTSIDIDHAEYLGDTREKIGFEKAGIFRSGKPAICGDPLCPQSIVDHAQAVGADLWRFGSDFNYSGDRQQWAYGGREQRRSGLAYPALRGANQLLNASAVLAALEALRLELVVPQQAVRMGLGQAALPGRFQTLPGTPVTILDVAHNPHAAAALAQNLDSMGQAFDTTHAVAGMYADKDIDGVIDKLLGCVQHWHCTRLGGPRGTTAEQLAQRIQRRIEQGAGTISAPASAAAPADSGRPTVRPAAAAQACPRQVKISTYDTPEQAFAGARELAQANDRIVVFGSFAVVGPVLQSLR